MKRVKISNQFLRNSRSYKKWKQSFLQFTKIVAMVDIPKRLIQDHSQFTKLIIDREESRLISQCERYSQADFKAADPSTTCRPHRHRSQLSTKWFEETYFDNAEAIITSRQLAFNNFSQLITNSWPVWALQNPTAFSTKICQKSAM